MAWEPCLLRSVVCYSDVDAFNILVVERAHTARLQLLRYPAKLGSLAQKVVLRVTTSDSDCHYQELIYPLNSAPRSAPSLSGV